MVKHCKKHRKIMFDVIKSVKTIEKTTIYNLLKSQIYQIYLYLNMTRTKTITIIN